MSGAKAPASRDEGNTRPSYVKMKKGFVLTECLIAVVLAALLLPLLVYGFSEYLDATIDLRQKQEAMRMASSCIEAAEGIGSVPSKSWFDENLAGALATYEIEAAISGSGSGRICEVTVRWQGRGDKQEISLSRQIR